MTVIDIQTETATLVAAPPDWIAQVAQMEEKYCREIRKVNPIDAILNLVKSYPAGYYAVKPYLEKYSDPKILEIGTGYGFGLSYLRKLGLNAVGIEPGNSAGFQGRYQQALELLEANNISSPKDILHSANGEALPFDDNSFDIIYSLDVLEHVRNIGQCLAEAHRVVKPNGVIVMAVPNYNAFREQHYNIFWLPHILRSKWLAKWYVKTFFGRHDWFIDELNFVTPGYFRKLVHRRTQLSGMKLRYQINPNIPILSRIFSHIGTAHYDLKSKNLMDRVSKRATGLLLELGEFIGLVEYCFLIWDPINKYDTVCSAHK